MYRQVYVRVWGTVGYVPNDKSRQVSSTTARQICRVKRDVTHPAAPKQARTGLSPADDLAFTFPKSNYAPDVQTSLRDRTPTIS